MGTYIMKKKIKFKFDKRSQYSIEELKRMGYKFIKIGNLYIPVQEVNL